MNKFFLAVGLLMVSAQGIAGVPDIVASNNLLQIQYRSTNVDYTETGIGLLGTRTGVLDTETGPVAGLGASVSAMKGPGNIYFHAEYDSSNGSTKYTGAFQGGVFGSVVGSSSATLTDYSLRLGKGVALREQFMLTPYFELGYHQWDRGVNYGETYLHYYYGAGVLGQYSPESRLVLSASAMIGNTFGSYITVNSGPGLYGFAGALGDSMISRIGAAADYAFTPTVHANIGVDYTSFSYGMSALYPVPGGVSWEPDSKTKYTTFRIGLGFHLD